MFVPNKRGHSSPETIPSKSTDDKEFVHVMGTGITGPLDRRSDNGKARDGVTGLFQMHFVSVRPHNGRVVT